MRKCFATETAGHPKILITIKVNPVKAAFTICGFSICGFDLKTVNNEGTVTAVFSLFYA